MLCRLHFAREPFDRLPEFSTLSDFFLLEIPIFLPYFFKFPVSGDGDLTELRRSAVNEFRTELNRHGNIFILMREDAAANAFTRFKHHDLASGTRKFARRRESGSAGADNDDWRSGHADVSIIRP